MYAALTAQAALPTPLVNLRFSEPSGLDTENTGSLGGSAALVQADGMGYPVLTNITPTGQFTPPANSMALDMGPINTGNFGRAMDLAPATGDGTLGPLNQFTVCGWLNPRNLAVGPGGNRIAFALDAAPGNGFDVVQLQSGALRVGINQWPDAGGGGGPTSAVVLKADPNTGVSNWVFFAVTYDSTLTSGNLKYFFGSPFALASQSSAHNYKGPDIGMDGAIPYTGQLTIGNFGTVAGARDHTGANSRVFRGLIDELRVFDVALDLAQIQEAQMNGAPPAIPASITDQPRSAVVYAGNAVTFNVVASGTAPFTFQWQRNGQDISGETSSSYTIPEVTGALNNSQIRVKVSNAGAQNVMSDVATLTVLTDEKPRVSLSFSDGDTFVTNTGTLEGAGIYVAQNGFPKSSSKVPSGAFAPANNIASVDLGAIAAGQGGRAIDLTNKYGGTLSSMAGFTIAGWLNAIDLQDGPGGNRIVHALTSANGQGIDLVQLEDGSLRIGVNEWPDAPASGGPSSSPGRITADPELGAGNWVFFAVTYDSSLPDNNVSYYFGSPTVAAELDVPGFYTRGPILQSGRATVGNFTTVDNPARTATGGNSRVFRGLVDEFNFFGRALTLDEVRNLQKAPAYRPVQIDPPTVVQQPQSQTTFAGQNVGFNVVASGTPPLSYQWWQKQGGTESAVIGATNQGYSLPAVAQSASGNEYWVVVSNQRTNVASQRATLTVLADDNKKVSLSFSEGTGLGTANAGNLGGTANFVQANNLPVFSTLVPSGANAPANNTSSIDFGVIGEGEGNRAIDLVNGIGSTLGSMPGFTLSGWLNARDLDAGWGGNRIVYAANALNGPGFDLVQQEDGSLRIGINEWPDAPGSGGPTSSQGKISADPDAGANNWVFFAVTYDSTLPAGQVSYYFGTPTQAAELDMPADYAAGPIESSGSLTLGNFSTVDTPARTAMGPDGASRVFRGLMDEINVYNRALTLAEIQALQKAPANAAPVEAPRLSAALQQNQFRLTWESSANFQLQFRDSLGAGAWADETIAPVVSGNQKTVTVQAAGQSRFYRLIKR